MNKSNQCNMGRSPDSIEGQDAKPARPYNSAPMSPSPEAPKGVPTGRGPNRGTK